MQKDKGLYGGGGMMSDRTWDTAHPKHFIRPAYLLPLLSEPPELS